MRKARLQKVSIPTDVEMFALYSANSIIKQAWALNSCDLLDFEMLEDNFCLNLKKHNTASLHSIYISKLAEHFDAWLLENRGSKALLSPKNPVPSSFIIVKGGIETNEMEYITEHIKNRPEFQHLVAVDSNTIGKTSWLTYIELCQPKTTEPKPRIYNIHERPTL